MPMLIAEATSNRLSCAEQYNGHHKDRMMSAPIDSNDGIG